MTEIQTLTIPRDFLEKQYHISDAFLEEVIKNIKASKDIFNGIVAKHSIFISDKEPFRKLIISLQYIRSRYVVRMCLVFVKYSFDDHVSLICIRNKDETVVDSELEFYNLEHKIMPKMEHIGQIVYSLLTRQKIDKDHILKTVTRIRSKDYGKPLSDITIVCS